MCHIFPFINCDKFKAKIISCNEMVLVAKTACFSVGTEFLNIIWIRAMRRRVKNVFYSKNH